MPLYLSVIYIAARTGRQTDRQTVSQTFSQVDRITKQSATDSCLIIEFLESTKHVMVSL